MKIMSFFVAPRCSFIMLAAITNLVASGFSINAFGLFIALMIAELVGVAVYVRWKTSSAIPLGTIVEWRGINMIVAGRVTADDMSVVYALQTANGDMALAKESEVTVPYGASK